MHFWIDKRSSQLYNYGGGGSRRPGAGGFYSRTYGTRHLPPRSLSSASSNNASSSHYQMRDCHPPPDILIRNNNSNGSSSGGGGSPFQIPFTSRFRFQGTGNNGNQQQSQQTSSGSSFRYPVNIGDPVIQQNGDCRNHLGEFITSSPGMINQSTMTLRGGINAGMMGPPSRRPRSQGQGSFQPGRRRSSSGSVSNPTSNQQRRTSMYRWTYDPNHHQYPRPPPTDHNPNIHNHHHHQQQQVWNEINDAGHQHQQQHQHQHTGIQSPNSQLSTPINISDLTSGVTEGTTSTSSQSVSDPAWKRTKRIGLTLCFMAFILLSTVAAKFVIEGPWLIDKTPRSERTEATIYFFLTELIFVAFAMALFFTGVTCLRKRTNAYLLRQFNQYILQTSPHGTETIGSPDYFNATRNPNHPNGVGMPSIRGVGSHGSNMIPQRERPFAYLPSLETTLLMNDQSSNLVIGGVGCSKPPPYHIALYLPVPDDYSSSSNKDPNSCSEGEHGQYDGHSHHSSPWISSSSCGVNIRVDGRGRSGNDGADVIDKTEDSDDEMDEGIPRRKRQKKDEEVTRSETPPPPYGQI